MAINSGLRDTNGGIAAPPFTKAAYTWDKNLTLSGTNTLSGTTTVSGALTNSATATFSGARVSLVTPITSVDKMRWYANTYTATGTITANQNLVLLNSTSKITMELPSLGQGQELFIINIGTSTKNRVSAAGGAFKLSGNTVTATFSSQWGCLHLIAASTTQGVVLSSTGVTL